MDAFASEADLSLRLKRQFTPGEQTWVTSLLEDASTYLREDVIRQQVYPRSTVTFTAWPDSSGVVVLPQQPVVSVTAVTASGVPVAFVWRDARVTVGTTEKVAVTFTFGYELPPEGLKRWACVLVSQALAPIELSLGLTAGGLSSVALDDFKVAFADAGESTGITLSDRNIELIRSQYNTGSHVVEMR